MPSRYDESIELLSPLETFDASAFVGDDDCPQTLCDFVLTLALIYNDFRNVIIAQPLLESVAPADRATPTPALGQIGGLHTHMMRILAGLLYELLRLVKENGEVTKSSEFRSVLNKLHPKARAAWHAVHAAAEDRPQDDSMAMFLVRVRNKVAYHYDPEELGVGYRRAFLSSNGRIPYISRGERMSETRFYFADAAANDYMSAVTGEDTAQQFFTASLPLLREVNHALRELVVMFINSRVGWRDVLSKPGLG